MPSIADHRLVAERDLYLTELERLVVIEFNESHDVEWDQASTSTRLQFARDYGLDHQVAYAVARLTVGRP